MIIGLFLVGMSVVFYPWAVPFPGRETLSGRWIGQIHSSEGPDGWMFLKLEPRPTLAAPWTHVSGSRQFNSKAGSRLQGEAKLCTGLLGRIDLDIDGYTTAWSGETLYILTLPRNPGRNKPRIRMEGQWNGSTLELEQEGNNLDEALGVPGKGGNTPEDWIRADLKKGDESDWLALCEELERTR